MTMSFAQEIKQEVLSQELAIEQARAFISGLISSSAERSDSKIFVKLNNPQISTIIKDLMLQLNINFNSAKENKNWIVLKNYKTAIKINQPSYFFAGAFVGNGSISDTASNSYHLEIQFYSHAEAEKLQKFLNKYSFKFTLIQRRKLFVLYLKKSEQISDFLRAIQAFKALMQFEDARISRDMYNQLNRYSNLDAYNQQKLAKASAVFVKQYQKIKDNRLTHLFRGPEIAFYEMKMRNKYSSLDELTKMYEKKTGIKKTRAGLNHWIIKLRNIANN